MLMGVYGCVWVYMVCTGEYGYIYVHGYVCDAHCACVWCVWVCLGVYVYVYVWVSIGVYGCV